VYVHATAYGLEGPSAHRPLYASAASAVTGGYQRQSGYWMDPERSAALSAVELREVIRPRLRGIADGDANAAVALFSALMLGLLHQRRTGEGQFLATSMIGGNAYAYSDDFNTYPGKPPLPAADPEQYGLSALYRLYETASGWIFLAATDEREWQALAGALGRSDLTGDPRFASAPLRARHDDALVSELSACLIRRGAADWEARLSAAGVGCAHVFEGGISAFTCTDPVLRETGLVAEVEHPTLGRLLRHGLPVSLSDTPGRLAGGCLRGQHTRSILGELGCSPGEIESLLAREIVFAGESHDAHAS
jgi:crotonobetainyl-CoA:carnitine CoA-transferase CaiB-like acyl-CoA transferase